MIRALLIANATAFAVLAGAHFMPHPQVRTTAEIAPSLRAPMQIAQRAVMSEQSLNVAERSVPTPSPLSHSLVF